MVERVKRQDLQRPEYHDPVAPDRTYAARVNFTQLFASRATRSTPQR